MRLISWNIDSLNAALTSDSARALLSREVLKTIIDLDPDIIGFQETKLSVKGLTKKHIEIIEEMLPDYEYVYRSSVEPARKGYAGTMFLYKKGMNVKVSYPEIGAPTTMDFEGRIITLELDDCYVTQVYTPNAGDGLRRLEERQVWDCKYMEYLKTLDEDKPVLACGDYNVAHNEIDLANPASNHMSPGFTDEERSGFTNLLGAGFVDTFRHKNGMVEGAYSWWAQRVKTSKINNTGWRIDYWLVSERVADRVESSIMVDSGPRQDHTPILMDINL
ncbi:MAG: exodeoxyribonuclease III [Peptostreptococcus anaerobius]